MKVVKSRDKLSLVEIAGRAEDHERAALRVRRGAHGFAQRFHRRHHVQSFLMACPPNSWRIIASSLSVNESASRERSRSSSESVMTGAGTSRATASKAVQRPSPESSTYGLMPASAGLSFRPSAIRSSSDERTTLPVRQV